MLEDYKNYLKKGDLVHFQSINEEGDLRMCKKKDD